MIKRIHTRKVLAAAGAAALLTLTGCFPFSMLSKEQSGFGADKAETPRTKTFAGYAKQKVAWRDCGSDKCAKVSAPVNWDRLDGDSIELALRKIPSKSAHPKGTIFVNPGGPGAPGTDYLQAVSSQFDTLLEGYDVIAWDPRGVGASSQVVCYDDGDLDDYLFNTRDDGEIGSEKWLSAMYSETKKLGKACLENTGELLKHVDTRSTVRDLDLLRAIVGDSKLNYLGFSYGTYIGARYADMFPKRVGRMVLDGAMDPQTSTTDVVRAQSRGFESALRTYVTACLSSSKCPFHGTVDEAMAEIHGFLERTEKSPLPGDGERRVSVSTLLTAIVTPLYSQENWPYLNKLFEEVRQGRGETALSLADFYYDRGPSGYENNSSEAFIAINCLDYPVNRKPDVAAARAEAQKLAAEMPTIGKYQGYSEFSCLGWPVKGTETRDPVTAAGADPIVVIGTTGDPATPYAWAKSLAKQLESGVLVTYRGEGHTAFGNGNSCISGAVHNYFLKGKVPGEVTCEAEPGQARQ